jgi:hypothetical protein
VHGVATVWRVARNESPPRSDQRIGAFCRVGGLSAGHADVLKRLFPRAFELLLSLPRAFCGPVDPQKSVPTTRIAPQRALRPAVSGVKARDEPVSPGEGYHAHRDRQLERPQRAPHAYRKRPQFRAFTMRSTITGRQAPTGSHKRPTGDTAPRSTCGPARVLGHETHA